jgi:hypothetical protein
MAILNTAPQDEVVLSNVGAVGEFRIRNSAKAFNILSSGLYANKVRAIIRELSCNAVDSHIAAGKEETPFEVHLPVHLEPWFSVRDFGTGLNHEQVTQIYTTYFESTKTNSNAFIGALGLGSKSPFSYTDNFTVTAVQDGVQRIYSAFINGDGVPSIVKMGEQETTEANGVEVKFSVNDRYDFQKFEQEARHVYTHFKLRPTVKGNHNFTFSDMSYETKDIIPGVHSYSESHTSSRAIMGNIAYPISIPEADKSLGELRNLLKCGLELHFGIGELDFQASREGLSYIPQTIEAIKNKLAAVNTQLAIFLSTEADKIENKWERSLFLYGKKRNSLWTAAVTEYVNNTGFELYDTTSQWSSGYVIPMTVKDLAAANLVCRGFSVDRHRDAAHNSAPSNKNTNKQDATGRYIYEQVWEIPVDESVFFVINDTKIGATERAKYHWRKKTNRSYRERVYVFEAIDRTKPVDKDAVAKLFYNPPQDRFFNASDLDQKDRATGVGRNVTLLRLEERGGSRYHRGSNELVWRDAGAFSNFDVTKTYYYIPLSGYSALFTAGHNQSAHDIVNTMLATKLPEFNVPVYGVRKTDHEAIKTQKNWVNLETFLVDTLTVLDKKIQMSGIKASIADNQIFKYNINSVVEHLNDGTTKELLAEFIGLPKEVGEYSVNELLRLYRKDAVTSFKDEASKYNDKFTAFAKRYPLIEKLETYRTSPEDIANYINVIDSVKGV